MTENMAKEKIYRSIGEILAPEHTALILIDMQVDFVSDDGKFGLAGRDMSEVQGIIPNCRRLLRQARESGVTVIHVQQNTLPGGLSDGRAWYAFKTRDGKAADYALPGSRGARTIEELAPEENEIVVVKYRPSAFHGTFLDQILRANGVESTLMVGNTAEGCVMATTLESSFYDYYTCLAEDAVASSVKGMKETAFTFMKARFKVYQTEEILDVWKNAEKQMKNTGRK